ncbi:hypothetical protein OQ252_04510 [Acetobacter farinalis]|uniref:Transposase n=1 Tax=Acetobacter farinalis TaxID=1260984 RepID=A0ABT3Q5V5_9PROT|nr:hypothetical protein [Acetobacter farinalis]MCX2560665.1 hypothetical protein [Acetobacter farinalis]
MKNHASLSLLMLCPMLRNTPGRSARTGHALRPHEKMVEKKGRLRDDLFYT